MKKKLFFILNFLVVVLMFVPIVSLAQNSFGVTPTKIETRLTPGQSETKFIRVANLSTETKTFTVGVEDYRSTEDSGVVIGNDIDDPLSLFRYIEVNQTEFTLDPGEETVVGVDINLPDNMTPGSKHAAVLISSREVNQIDNGAKTVSRIGVLLFVRVSGQEELAGRLISAGILNRPILWGETSPVAVLSYENSGNTYLNPYGYIELTNVFTRKVTREEIEPWFVLPNSARIRELPLSSVSGGVYQVKILLNRGYDNIIDESSHLLAVVTPLFVFGCLLILGVLTALLVFLIKKYGFKHE